MNVVTAYTNEDRLVVISYDEMPQDPREWDTPTIFWAWHRRYNIGDPDTVTRHGVTYSKPNPEDYANWDALADMLYKEHRAVDVRKVYLMDHSGLSLSLRDFRDRWDSGQCGVIWLPRSGLADLGYKRSTKQARHKANALFESEIKVQDAYVSGAVFAWDSYTCSKDGDTITRGEAISSCTGYFGRDEFPYMLQEAFGGERAAKRAKEIPDRDFLIIDSRGPAKVAC